MDIAFHGRACTFTIDRTNLDAIAVSVLDGFIPLDEAKVAFGAEVPGTPAAGAPGVHLAKILVGMIRRTGVWRGKALKSELNSTVIMIALHFEASLEYFNIIPLRRLTEIAGSGGRARHVNDIQRKEELMQLATRCGAALTASRLNTAFRAYELDMDQPLKLPGIQTASAPLAAGAQFNYSGKFGACGFFSALKVMPVIAPVVRGPERDQSDHESFVMQQYGVSLFTGIPQGPLHFAFDGVLAKYMGEINQYLVMAPERKEDGVEEITGWCPIQVY